MIRRYQPSDLEALKRMHAAQGYDYQFPDVESPLFLSKLVLEEEGRPVMATLARATAEAYLLLDPEEMKPAERWERILHLIGHAERDLSWKGMGDVHAFVPPEAATFMRALERIGWERDDRFTPYSKILEV